MSRDSLACASGWYWRGPALVSDNAHSPRFDWPVCSYCGQRRQAKCPACGQASEDFPLADAQPESTTLLLCPICDEAFSPRYYRRCAACGADFGEGLEGQAQRPAEVDINRRAIWVMIAVVILIVSLMAYFEWVAR